MILLVFLLLFIIFLGYFNTKSVIVNILLCSIVCILFAYSQDDQDWHVYQKYYEGNIQESYELGFAWLNQLSYNFGLTYLEFRLFIGVLFCSVLFFIIRKLTKHTNVVWSTYLIYSAMFDACILRNSLSMLFAIPGILFLIQSKRSRDFFAPLICFVIAALIHNSFWFFLIFIPFWLIIQSKNGIAKVCVFSIVLYFICVINTSFLFDLFGKLIVREGVIDKYETGRYANFNGAVYNLLKYLFYISPILYYKYFNTHSQNYLPSNRLEALLNKHILDINILFIVLLVPQFFAITFSRFFRILCLFNYLFLANQVNVSSQKRLPKVISLIYATVLLFLIIFWESPGTFEGVFLMHFETNSVFEIIKNI
jgi:hypothetical protein